MSFTADITIKEKGIDKDNTIKDNTQFIKIWKIKNIGYKAWSKKSYILTTSNGLNKKQLLLRDIKPNESVLVGIKFDANYMLGSEQIYYVHLYDYKNKLIPLYNNKKVIPFNTKFYVESQKCYLNGSCRHDSYKQYQDILYPRLTKNEANQLLKNYLNIDISNMSIYKNLDGNKILTRFYATQFIFEASLRKNKTYVDNTVYGIQIREDGLTFNKSILENIKDAIYANEIKKNIIKANAESYSNAQKFVLGSFLFPIKRKNDDFYWTKEMRYVDFEYAVKKLKKELK